MSNEVFRAANGVQIIVVPMWGGARVVGLNATHSRLGKTQYPSVQAAYADLRANSTRM